MTILTTPHDHVPRADKSTVQAAIPTELYQNLFCKRFPMRGAQIAIITTLLDWFDRKLTSRSVPTDFDVNNETLAQQLLNDLNNDELTTISTL